MDSYCYSTYYSCYSQLLSGTNREFSRRSRFRMKSRFALGLLVVKTFGVIITAIFPHPKIRSSRRFYELFPEVVLWRFFFLPPFQCAYLTLHPTPLPPLPNTRYSLLFISLIYFNLVCRYDLGIYTVNILTRRCNFTKELAN